MFAKDKEGQAGAFAKAAADALAKAPGYTEVDVAPAVSLLLAPKDEVEQVLVRSAARLSADLLHKTLKNKVLDVVDAEEEKLHSAISDEVNALMEDNPEKCKSVLKLKLEPENVSSCYEPIVQSGGEYSLKPSWQSTDEPVKTGVVLCSLGARYKSYCSNVGRTFLIEPTKAQERTYRVVLKMQEVALEAIKPGASFASVRAAVVGMLEAEHPELAPKLPKSLGFCTGIEFKESTLSLSAKCGTALLAAGMTLVLATGLDRVENEDAKGEADAHYSMQLVDTVLVTAAGKPEVLTASAKSDYESIMFEFKDEGDEEAEQKEEAERQARAAKALEAAGMEEGRSRRTAQGDLSEDKRADAAIRAKNQAEIAERVEEEARARQLRLADDQRDKLSKRTETFCYRRPDQMDGDACRKLVMFVDNKRDAVVLPIFGMPVPFHVSTIKNVAETDSDAQGQGSSLQIKLDVPGVTLKPEYAARGEGLHYVKELTFRSQSAVGIHRALRMIKAMQSRHRQEVTEQKEVENYVQQDDLIVNKRQPSIKLAIPVFCRPTLGKKRQQGILEAHQNGFLFTAHKGEKVVIIFNRIKHAFFQKPASSPPATATRRRRRSPACRTRRLSSCCTSTSPTA